jgi:hypothetical protein
LNVFPCQGKMGRQVRLCAEESAKLRKERGYQWHFIMTI